MTCTSCGAETALGARFCPSCGHALETRADERRVVTVVFADLIGFTTYSERRDPEHVKNVVDRCFQRLAGDITAFGGRVDKIVGDGLVALFGAPVAHEDDAERAVRAALQMQQTLAQAQDDLELRMRVGVNTGQVLVGALRAGGDYTVMGDVVNVASRLQTVAEAGQVVVGPDTYAVTRDVIAYEPLGHVQARGREEPIESWIAQGTLAPPGRRPQRAATPLVGRDHEMATLNGALGNAFSRHRPQLVLLLGEAGVGKSRLASELAATAAHVHGALVLDGRCIPYGEANLWWPLAEAIRGACGIEASDTVADMRAKTRKAVDSVQPEGADPSETERLTTGLLYLLGDAEALAALEPARAEEEALRTVEMVLERQGRESPVVLVLSELHWADQKVLDSIDSILGRIHSLDLVVIGTARGDLLDRWTPRPGRHNVLVMHVDPLDSHATEEMLAALLGPTATPALRQALIARSGGNPFFLEELVTLLGDPGALSRPGGGVDLPATLRGLVAARIDGLDRSARNLLEHAAVFGRHGPLAALAEAAGGPTDADLDQLIARDLLAVDDERWSFRSDLVRDVAYETLAKAERARRHAAIAAWLREGHDRSGREDDLELLAHHAGLAAQLSMELGGVEGVPAAMRDTALHALERAAIRAKHRDHHEVALRLLDQVEHLLPVEDEANTRRMLLARAHSRTALRDTARARADIEAVLPMARAAGNLGEEAFALTILGQAQQHEADFDASARTLADAVDAYRMAGDLSGEANALRLLGMTRLFSGRSPDAVEPISQALEAFRATGDRRGQGWALQNLAWIAFSSFDMPKAEAHIDEALELFRSVGDRAGESYAVGLLGWVRLTQGHLEEANAIADRILDDSPADHGDRWARAMTMSLRANARLWLGRPAEAVDPARDARAVFIELGEPLGRFQSQAILARALISSGQIDEGLAIMNQAIELVPAGSYMSPLISGMPAVVAAQIGDPVGARAAFRHHAGERDRDPSPGGEPDRLLWATIEMQEGQFEKAAAAFGRIADETGNDGTRANALALGALAAAGAGDSGQARERAERLLAGSQGSYLDAIQAKVALAFAAGSGGSRGATTEAFDTALKMADATSDRIAQALVRLAMATALADPGVGSDADSRLDAMGVPAAGWRRVFAAATSHLPALV